MSKNSFDEIKDEDDRFQYYNSLIEKLKQLNVEEADYSKYLIREKDIKLLESRIIKLEKIISIIEQGK